MSIEIQTTPGNLQIVEFLGERYIMKTFDPIFNLMAGRPFDFAMLAREDNVDAEGLIIREDPSEPGFIIIDGNVIPFVNARAKRNDPPAGFLREITILGPFVTPVKEAA